MLTRLKLKRGEGQLVKAQSNPLPRRARVPLSPPSISPQREAEEAISMTSREGEIPEVVDPNEEERVFRKAFLDLTEMVRVLYQERNQKLEGEGSSGGKKDEDKSKKGNGGNGDPPSPSSSSSSSSSTSVNQSHKSKNTGKSPFF
jgi:hypothetical protein